MNDQRRDEQNGQSDQHDQQRRDAPGAGKQDQHSAGGHDRMPSEKPKTEQASHQGGGGVRSDHRPQSK